MKDFNIPIEYCTSVYTHKTWNMYTTDGKIPTDDELLLIMQGKGNCSVTESSDHPEFAKLREQLGSEGYIYIERSWWNGDRVLKPFNLNGVTFTTGTKFSCASAMQYRLSNITILPRPPKKTVKNRSKKNETVDTKR